MKQIIENIQKDQSLIFTYDSRPMTENMKCYSAFYNLPTEDLEYCYGFESIAHERLFIQSFRPRQTKAHILLLHGYYDHVGMLGSVIDFLVQQKFHVLTFDLPGHGLSSGERGTISEFALYVESVQKIVNNYLSSSSLPIYIVAHSTGAAAAMDYLLNNHEAAQIQKAIFICPLIRTYGWNTSILWIKPLQIFTKKLKRVFRNNSSDSRFLQFVKNDPLQYNQVPLSWVEALIRWNKQLVERQQSSPVPVLILQGKKDTTVDWRYNIDFLLKKFPKIDVELIRNGRHHLLNEEKLIRDKVFSSIHHYLTGDT